MYPPTSPEPWLQIIRQHRQSAMRLIQKARARRSWLRLAQAANPGVSTFYGENLDLLANELRYHRKTIRQCRARQAIAAAQAQAQRVTA